MESKIQINELKPAPSLPDRFRSDSGRSVPRGIVGARIIHFGAAPLAADLEGGGLVIDYLPAHSKRTIRAVLAFTELGMWVSKMGALDYSRKKSSAIRGEAHKDTLVRKRR